MTSLITLGFIFVVWAILMLVFNPKKRVKRLPPVDVDTTLYVDEINGSDNFDGTSWEQARASIDNLPKQLNATLTIRLRKNPLTCCNVSGFSGVGKLMLQGELPPKINRIDDQE